MREIGKPRRVNGRAEPENIPPSAKLLFDLFEDLEDILARVLESKKDDDFREMLAEIFRRMDKDPANRSHIELEKCYERARSEINNLQAGIMKVDGIGIGEGRIEALESLETYAIQSHVALQALAKQINLMFGENDVRTKEDTEKIDKALSQHSGYEHLSESGY